LKTGKNTGFNPRPCARGDGTLLMLATLIDRFQSTPLREGRLLSLLTSPRHTRFNPRPCARGDAIKGLEESIQPVVSIHAPARGATFLFQGQFAPSKVSIHAPARGATSTQGKMRQSLKFQSTPLREGRHTHYKYLKSYKI